MFSNKKAFSLLLFFNKKSPNFRVVDYSHRVLETTDAEL